MDGPAHYRKSEQILASLEVPGPRGRVYAGPQVQEVILLRAVAHAVLAAAAATALGTSPAESRAWADAAGTEPGGR